MSTRTNKQNSHEAPTQVQIRLIRSQARGLWITSSIAILVSIASFSFSFYTYLKDNDEICSVNTCLIENNYDTMMMLIDDSPGISIKYKTDVINLSKNPVTIISYFLIKESDIKRNNIEKMDWREILKDDYPIYHEETKLDSSIRLEPGSSCVLPFKHFIDMDYETFKYLRKELGNLILPDSIHVNILSVINLYYKSQKDFFGNTLEADIDKDGFINRLSSLRSNLKYDDPFYFIIKTAKGNFISTKVKWYYGPQALPPFDRLIFDLKQNTFKN